MIRIEYYLSAASPFAYLGHDALAAIAARHGAEIDVRPLTVRRLFAETGGVPLRERHPARQAYRRVDLMRWRAERNLPLDLDPPYPLEQPAQVERLAIAIGLSGGNPMPFLGAAMAALWAGRRNLADEAVLLDLLSRANLDGPALLASAGSDEAAAVHERNLADATAAGVFGAPSYVLDGEVFWGQDRLAMLDAALASGRAPYRPEG
jgi:2-hydroxychromene-2-carboxylate isomerase